MILTMTKSFENLLRDSTLSLLPIAKTFFILGSLDNSKILFYTFFWDSLYQISMVIISLDMSSPCRNLLTQSTISYLHFIFLGATKHLYKRVCPSVRQSVGLSICLFITPFHLPLYRGVSAHLMPCIRPCFTFSCHPWSPMLANVKQFALKKSKK